jgi:hypothetical protein
VGILEVLSITSLAAMDPKSPSSRHPTDIEEEDSPLQQSVFPPDQPMANSYLEDIASKAEEYAEDPAAKEMAEEEEHDGGAEAKEPEQIPVKLHGYWVKCHVKDAHVLALEREGTVAPKAESQWWTHHKALVPTQSKTEILILKSHIERGFNMPPSHFFSDLL